MHEHGMCAGSRRSKKGVAEYGCPAILNSDQGSQFTSDEYKALLKDLHILQSIDGKSRWADNIMIERWFRSLKVKYIFINEFPSTEALRTGIAAYIHSFNTMRPHEALDFETPDQAHYACFRVAAA